MTSTLPGLAPPPSPSDVRRFGDDDDDDDREITAITALELETTKATDTLAKLRESTNTRMVLGLKNPATPPPAPHNNNQAWKTRALYNNSIFDIGFALPLIPNQPLRLQEAIEQTVKSHEGVVKVNIMLIEGELNIRWNTESHTINAQGQVYSFSRYEHDFNAVKLHAIKKKTRFLIVVWRSDD